ncbi:MAG: bifunctional (p)ppGpp synthetase/guanosine-3',5'-bis(diphosphate) 3'-pyrophosphohydrolase [Deltaproteobacteria bacterium]|nr:bifunctional (p)ppGpp synthetase/guanosine-3',5'-bis(diphosphate) 3'-pyrophosphohydrolase [Deltaproteobacteria bacterium]
MRLDVAAVAAALLFSALDEPGSEAAAELGEVAGGEVAKLVAGVAKLARIRWDRIEEEAAETLREMFLAMAADVRVVLIALALRVQALRALVAGEGSAAQGGAGEAERMARETIEVFAPLANRLGVWQFKWELEDLSLRLIEPAAYVEIEQLLAERREERGRYIAELTATLEAGLREAGIAAAVSGRPKHIYSIYKKMQRKAVSFAEIFDVTAVRVITEKTADCYAALGLVHSLWAPLKGEFDDYVARPKDNNYQSLHTAVMGPHGRPVEIQIRTREMHRYAEYGVAAHWAYKEKGRSPREADAKFSLLRRLMDWEREVTDPHQLVEALKTDIFKDRVYVFTPAGDAIDLPQGATPLDFAYRVHTQVGHRCRGARVNDQIVPLDYQLKTGERVEILTHKKPSPSRDWLNPAFGYLKTSHARSKVRQFFRAQGRDQATSHGREVVDKELARLELKHARIEDVAASLRYAKVEDLYAAVGFGDRSPQGVASAALVVERAKAPPAEPPVPPSVPLPPARRAATGVSMGGVDDILGKRARCCNPVPGDDVMGFVSRGRGVVIHRRDCANLVDHPEPERLVEIDWGPERGQSYPVYVAIEAQDRPGLLRDLSELITQAGVNVRSARGEGSAADGIARLRLSLEFSSAEQVVSVLGRLERLPDVLEVRRMGQ